LRHSWVVHGDGKIGTRRDPRDASRSVHFDSILQAGIALAGAENPQAAMPIRVTTQSSATPWMLLVLVRTVSVEDFGRMSIWRLPVLESRSAAAESGTTVQARLPVPHSKLKDINHAP
jgi:hypothetical protein